MPDPARLTIPASAPSAPYAAGLHRLDHALVLAPDASGPLPLVVMFHGAGADGSQSIALLRELAERAQFLLVAPSTLGRTWDLLAGGWAQDVAALRTSLDEVVQRWPVDPSRAALAGFSDGASYALSLGLTNGDAWPEIVAFAPGFAAPEGVRGDPSVFVAHGEMDRVLPIDHTSRRLVPRLREAGVEVEYVEHPAGHRIPPQIADAAYAWLTARWSGTGRPAG
jgi:phospholipase/carboxylesterase